MKNFVFNVLTKLFQLVKTLKFKLQPIGRTAELIKKNNLIGIAEARQEKYQKVKKMVDERHKSIIDDGLKTIVLPNLDMFATLYYKKDKSDSDRKQLEGIKGDLRKQISDAFKNNPEYEFLDKDDLFKGNAKEGRENGLLYEWIYKNKDIIPKILSIIESDNEELIKEYLTEFENFPSYFSKYHESRRNMYSYKKNHGTIAYRIVHENLPTFLNNIKMFKKIIHSGVDFKCVEQELENSISKELLLEIFSANYYNNFLTQKGIDYFNSIIGILNKHINLYNQKQKEKSKQLPKLERLYKQILSDVGTSFIDEPFERDSDNEVLSTIENFYNNELLNCVSDEKEPVNIFSFIKNILSNLNQCDLSKIFIQKGKPLSSISQKLFNDYGFVEGALEEYYQKTNPIKDKEKSKDFEKRKKQWMNQDISIKTIQDAISQYGAQMPDKINAENCITDYFANFNYDEKIKTNILEKISASYNSVKNLLRTPYPEETKLIQNDKHAEQIQNFLDSIKALELFIKPLSLKDKDKNTEKDDVFYESFYVVFKQLKVADKLYNRVRNYITQKPYSKNKFIIHLGNKGNLLKGFTESNGQTQYGAYVFTKINEIGEKDYFLATSTDVTLFSKDTPPDSDDISEYRRLNYYQLNLKAFFGSSYLGRFGYYYAEDKIKLIEIIKNFINNSENEEFKTAVHEKIKKQKNEETPGQYIGAIREFSESKLEELLKDKEFSTLNQKVIDNILILLREKYLSNLPNAQSVLDREHTLFSSLMSELETIDSGNRLFESTISNKEFLEATNRDEKSLLLFKITDQDLSYAETFASGKRKKRGKKDLQTLYLEQLLGNLEQTTFDLGSGEIFFRKASLKYPEKIMKYGHHYEELKDKFLEPIIKDERFLYDLIQLNLSTILNYNQKKPVINYQGIVNELIKSNSNIHIMGIDRGERNLITVVITDLAGNIKEQITLNFVNGKNYLEVLRKKGADRTKAKREWKTVVNIKDSKKGYLSHAIHLITELMVKYNAVICVEQLGSNFKRNRQHIDFDIYQQFENMLISKLGYYADKNLPADEIGGVLNALQLANRPEINAKQGAYDDVKQSGIVSFIPPWFTTSIDPNTGFVNFLKPKWKSVKQSAIFFSKFDAIRYNSKADYFEFSFDYKNFPTKTQNHINKWTACTTNYNRYLWDKTLNNGKGAYVTYDITKMMKELFKKYNISYENGKCIKSQIVAQKSEDFFKGNKAEEGLLKLLRITLTLRHKNEDSDCIISPVADKNGVFFNSRLADATMPQSADYNGAYHIALKGLMCILKIKEYEGANWGKLNLKITNEQWLEFAQTKALEK